MDGMLLTAALLIPALVIAIVFHEVAHGWAALALGDPTAKEQRRLTLNPIRHVDPVGTLLVPGALALFGGPVFGWAKPVPVAFGNLRNPRRDMILVAAAGPGSNLVMALGWALIAAAQVSVLQIGGSTGQWIIQVCQVGIFINVLLALFNMLPIPPLDGGQILMALLPRSV